MARFTGKQKAFINHYFLCGFNATEAARLAGYRAKNDATLAVIGCQNLRKLKIAAEISRRMSVVGMAADEVIARLTQQARADLADFITVDDEGLAKLDLKKAQAQGKLHLIKKLWYDKDGHMRLELHDPHAALVQIGRHHGLFTDKIIEVELDIDYSELTDEQVERIANGEDPIRVLARSRSGRTGVETATEA